MNEIANNGDAGGDGPGGDEEAGDSGLGPFDPEDRYGLADLAVAYVTIAGTLRALAPDISRSEGSSLIERGLALDRQLKEQVEALTETRHYLKNCVMEAIARGNRP